MIALLQRVSSASVVAENETVAAIDAGLLAFVGVEKNDAEQQAERLMERVLGYRIFSDDEGRMNRGVMDIGGALLLVPQFTLPADTAKGLRPSFTPAAEPARAEQLFEHCVSQCRARYDHIQVGRFAAHMQVALVNDGPATFILRAEPKAQASDRVEL